MTAPAYTSDLTLLSNANATTGWTEPTSAETGGGLPQNGTEFFIEGTACVSKACAGAGGITGGAVYTTTAQTITTPAAVYVWMVFAAPNTLDTRANGGFAIAVGSSTANYKKFYVLGSDNYAYGGWQCVAVDPSLTADATIGTPAGTYLTFGAIVKTLATISKGEPFGVDAVRFGRTLQVVSGETANYGTFAGAAATNDSINNRWGILQAIAGGYQLQGQLLLGTAGTAVDFRDANTSVLIANNLKVAAGFNEIEIRNASSRVDWTAISFLALGTLSRGNLLVTNDADVNIDACSFTNMGTFALLGSTAITNSTLRSCDTITAPGSTLSGTSVLTSRVAADASAVVWNSANDPGGELDNMTFSKGTNDHHAIEFGLSSPTTISLVGQTYTGFSASNNVNSSVLHIKRTTGTVTINVSGGDTPSYRSDGATVVVQNSVSVTLTGLVNPTEVRVYSQDGGGDSDVELAGQDDVATGTFNFSGTAGVIVNIVVYSVGYLPADIFDFQIPTQAASIPIQQVFDRQYENP